MICYRSEMTKWGVMGAAGGNVKAGKRFQMDNVANDGICRRKRHNDDEEQEKEENTYVDDDHSDANREWHWIRLSSIEKHQPVEDEASEQQTPTICVQLSISEKLVLFVAIAVVCLCLLHHIFFLFH